MLNVENFLLKPLLAATPRGEKYSESVNAIKIQIVLKYLWQKNI